MYILPFAIMGIKKPTKKYEPTQQEGPAASCTSVLRPGCKTTKAAKHFDSSESLISILERLF